MRKALSTLLLLFPLALVAQVSGTISGKVIDGTLQLCNASVHVNGDYSSAKRDWNAMEVVLDEDVNSADRSFYFFFYRNKVEDFFVTDKSHNLWANLRFYNRNFGTF